jgi:hypothetical protein
MSNALALAGTSAVLQSLLNGILNAAGLGTVTVTAVAPDIAQNSQNSAPNLQVNLFLHQVTPNAAWRNVGLPSLGADGSTRLRNQPLALDLHYLLTAYGTNNFEAEALLGFSVQTLHETPVLTRSAIQAALNPSPGTPPSAGSATLNLTGLANQVEMIKITPATLGREEMAWLWTALKADYRPTFPFLVTVVLIQSQAPASSPLPVLSRGITAQPDVLSPMPSVTEANPPNAQPAACLGDVITVVGTNLSGAAGVVLANPRLGIQQTITPLANVGNTSFTFTVPNPPAPGAGDPPTDLPAGIYLLTTQITPSETANVVALAIAPQIAASWAPGSLSAAATTLLSVPCAPFVRPAQQVSLIVGGREISANPFTTPTKTPSFTITGLQTTNGKVPVRLRVDGVDSPILDMTKTPPVFAGPSIQVTP